MTLLYHGHSSDPGIYRITNAIDDRVYIGSTYRFSQRWHYHRRDLRRGRHGNAALQADFNRLGEAAFVFEVVAIIRDEPERLAIEETAIAALFGPGCYNATIRCPPTPLGKKLGPCSPERKAKISAAHRGRKLSAPHRAKLSAAHRGKPLSAAHIEALRKAASTPEHRAKLSQAHRGKPLSPEHRAALLGRPGHTGRKLSEEHKARLSAAKLGKKLSPEHRAKLSAARSGRTLTAEHRANLVRAWIARRAKKEN